MTTWWREQSERQALVARVAELEAALKEEKMERIYWQSQFQLAMRGAFRKGVPGGFFEVGLT